VENQTSLKFPPTNPLKKIKDMVRYPKIQLRYEGDFKEDYSKMIKVLKIGIIQIINK
jgi:hypothetical protein